MKCIVRILFPCCVAVVLFAPWAHAGDSTNDRTAVRITPERSVLLFGPRATEFKYDKRMVRAAEIALSRAAAKPQWHCWHAVKDALLDAGVISRRPESSWAKEAGDELCTKFGFMKLPITKPTDAPVGAVIVYGGADAGHVELRTESGYVSDFVSPTPYPRPLIGVYVKGV